MRFFIAIIIVFLFLLYPTSFDGVIRDSVSSVSFDWAISFLFVIIALISYGTFDRKNIVISIIILVYLTIMTAISNATDNYSTFSVARLAPITLFLFLSTAKITYRFPMKKLFILFDIVMILIIVINVLILIENESIKKIIVDNYSQFYSNATTQMFDKKRPIFTFGVYTFASYFYTLLYLLSVYSFESTKKNKYKLYYLLLLFFNILLASNFSILSSLFMIFVLFVNAIKNKSSIDFIFFAILVAVVAIWIINNKQLIGYYAESIFSTGNGIAGRYSNEGVLMINNEYLQNHSNIGFNIIRNIDLTYTDSGYFVLRLMGGWIILIPYYYLFYRFMKNNFRSYYLYFLIITLLFEIAIPVSIYIKFAPAMIFCIVYLSSLRSYQQANNVNLTNVIS